jgi:hypothetical protein
MDRKRYCLFLLVVIVLGGCATVPTGPSVMVLPGPGKPFEVFQSDESACRQWAEQKVGTSPNEASNKTLAGGAVIGTGLGAALGAAIGSLSASAGAGAGIGALAGLIGGAIFATEPAYATGAGVQRQYDNAYQQCMYAKGNQIPGAVRRPRRTYPPPPPPPPPGYSPGTPVPPVPNSYPLPPT